MVGIVLVSHSRMLAEGVRELAEQMTQGRVRIATAGGIDDPDDPIGTDPMRVMAAIEEVYSDEGVLVLMDLGSALMSAEVAVEMLAPEMQERVRLCEAALVEGAIAAATQAMIGAALDQVVEEARHALVAKAMQLGIEVPSSHALSPENSVGTASEVQHELTLTVPNRLGLHARPASRVVATAGSFDASVTLIKDDRTANAQSINQVVTLNVRQGDELRIVAAGPQAEEALAALAELAAQNFGDEDEAAEQPQAAAPGPSVAPGTPRAAAPGIAVGPALRYVPEAPELPDEQADDPAAAWQALQDAIQRASEELQALQEQTAADVGAQEAAIFDAHRMILQDPDLQQVAQKRIEQEALHEAHAWQKTIQEMAANYRALDDDYLRARAGDVEDVGQRVLRQLLGAMLPALPEDEAVVLVAHDLAPSEVAQLSAKRVLALLMEEGGTTGHSAILARARGIPTVVGAGDLLHRVEDGDVVAVDGNQGRFWIKPDAQTIDELKAARQQWLDARAAAQATALQPAVTDDGVRIEVAANIGSAAEIAEALAAGAEGVGLFRTEFLFMDRAAMPDEAEQSTIYREVAEALDGRPLIIRTLDAGGDKPIAYLPIGEEANPFLGWRGIRYGLAKPAQLRVQLRAICRASAHGNVKLMFPMIGTLEEVYRARQHVRTAQQELAVEGVPFDTAMEIGVMIEVPAAVFSAAQIARHVDFFSIGTNDLTQYVMAADRGNARVGHLVDPLQPAVLRAIQQAADAAQQAGIWIGMCGAVAGDPLATPLLLGLGLRELSMSAPALPLVKERVRKFTLAEAQEIAQHGLTLADAGAVRTYLEGIA